MNVNAAGGRRMVTDQEIARGVETVLRQSDPNSVTTINGVVQQLEAKLGLDLSHKAPFIRDQIALLLRSHPLHPRKDPFAPPHHHPHHPHQQQQQQQPQPQPPSSFLPQHHHHHQQQPHHQQPQPQQQQHQQQLFPPSHFALQPPQDLNFRPAHAPPPAPAPPRMAQPQPQQQQQALPPPAAAAAAKAAQSAAPAASDSAKESAPAGAKRRGGAGGLNKVCGVSSELQAVVGEPALPRTEIVKQLWAYIRKNNLQDPSNKRKIICDDALRLVFETDCTDMFKMNKLLSKHIIPLQPTKESGQAKRLKVSAESRNIGSQPGPSPVIISEALAKFLGTGEREMLPSEAHGRVWEYIKIHQLEDPLNPMGIHCDARLRELLGCEGISALGVPEMLERHHLFKRS
ncbi:chromatin modification-related protein eaf-1 [Syzygium oleosum]|uniref:chromatin modification-related protein eaf-1 n=1 Tax=Syzygium oleosum TaxID=219896 RepID=UPI0024BBC01B|nr:chromatin modification-related protein eaf-1 [Syzygium oleosum]